MPRRCKEHVDYSDPSSVDEWVKKSKEIEERAKKSRVKKSKKTKSKKSKKRPIRGKSPRGVSKSVKKKSVSPFVEFSSGDDDLTTSFLTTHVQKKEYVCFMFVCE